MKVEVSPKVAKYLLRLDVNKRERIKKALSKLSLEPPQGDIKSMKGKDGFRLRIGKYRALFDIKNNNIIVYDIDIRGEIYKNGR